MAARFNPQKGLRNNSMKKKIFVTGCAGFIGSHFCERLLKEGFAVVGLDNENPFYDPQIKKQNIGEIKQQAALLKGDFTYIHGDIRDEDLVSKAFQDKEIQAIVHIAAMAGVRPSLEKPAVYADVNYTGTLVLLEKAKEAGIKNFVFASSSSVYGNCKKAPFKENEKNLFPISPYAATKLAGEMACHVYHRLYKMNISCLRFFTVYGPRQRPDLAINKFTHRIMAGQELEVYGDGKKKRDFTYIDDIVDGLYRSMLWTLGQDRPQYEVFNLGDSKTTSVTALIQLIEKTLGKKAKIKYKDDVPGDVDMTCAKISKAKKILGYHPKTKLKEGIKKYTDWIT